MNITDCELIALIIIVIALYFIGLKQREIPLVEKFTGVDLPTSAALKGIACVLILMGHYVNLRSSVVVPRGISKFVFSTTANIALVLFMFFSGYGLSLKKVKRGSGIQRLKKVYLPLLFTSVIAMILYCILPDVFPVEEVESSRLKYLKDIYMIHNFQIDYLSVLIPHALGWKDWYVFCIMIFYSFFYVADFLTRKNPNKKTIVLWAMFVAYFVCAYYLIGPSEAHWYRFCWVFFLGHVYAKMVGSGRINWGDMILLVVLLLTIFIESPFMILSYFMAIAIIIISAFINKKYTMNSRVLAFMGAISYFFYLSHIRIGYTIITYLNTYSVILWVVITIAISFCLKKLYDYVFGLLATHK